MERQVIIVKLNWQCINTRNDCIWINYKWQKRTPNPSLNHWTTPTSCLWFYFPYVTWLGPFEHGWSHQSSNLHQRNSNIHLNFADDLMAPVCFTLDWQLVLTTQSTCPAPSSRFQCVMADNKQQQRLIRDMLWTPKSTARAECGAGQPVPSNPAAMYVESPSFLQRSQNGDFICHYNPQLVGNLNVYATPVSGEQQHQHNDSPIENTPINVGGIKISLGSASDDRVNPVSQFYGTDSSDWEDPSLGKSGYGKSKSGMSRDCDGIVPISLDFSPPSLRTPEAKVKASSDVDPDTLRHRWHSNHQMSLAPWSVV